MKMLNEKVYQSFEAEVEYSLIVDRGRSTRFTRAWRSLADPFARIALVARAIVQVDPLGFDRMQAEGEEALQYTLEAIAIRHPSLFEGDYPEALIIARWRLQLPPDGKAA